MKNRLIQATALFAAGILIVMGCFYFYIRNYGSSNEKAEQIVALNEIEQLVKKAVPDTREKELLQLHEKVSDLQERIRSGPSGYNASANLTMLLVTGAFSLIFLLLLLGYVYFNILRPFEKMQRFAQQISAGDFDLPLNYERSNYFGAFTWAFDNMRREITKARACEREAVENNKTVIATLSHDIKTPIASIHAYAEALEANFGSTPEKRARYLGVIQKKCREVADLTNDLFIHSLSDLEKLKIQAEKVEIGELLSAALEDLSLQQDRVSFVRPGFSSYVWVDKKRFVQVIENIINNAGKYANTPCRVSVERGEGQVRIRFRDYGKGIPDEDMPFILNKFYRGRNSENEQGSGLGLYIVKYVMDRLKGRIELKNCGDGLEVMLELPEDVS